MKYQCPKCREIISVRALRCVAGRYYQPTRKKRNSGLIYLQACPRCGAESYHYNAAGEIDEGSWITLTDDGRKMDPLDEHVHYHDYVPVNLADCSNTGCLECVYDIEKGNLDRYQCPYRKKLETYPSGSRQPTLEVFGI